MKRFAFLALGLLAIGCGAAWASDPVPTPIGAGALFHPEADNPRVAARVPIRGLRCTSARRRWTAFHLEVFARGLVVLVPAGIGIAPPRASDGVYVTSGRCSYALRTREPTGVVELEAGTRRTLGDFFAVWGAPLTATRLAGFRAVAGERVRAYVAGRQWRGDIRAIPLTVHAQVVLQLGPYIPPHPSYHFPKGL